MVNKKLVKIFLPLCKEAIKDVSSGSSETFVCYAIQGHMLAKHFAECFQSHLYEKFDYKRFGRAFDHNVAKLGTRVVGSK